MVIETLMLFSGEMPNCDESGTDNPFDVAFAVSDSFGYVFYNITSIHMLMNSIQKYLTYYNYADE